MVCQTKQDKKYREIKQRPEMLNSGASKPMVGAEPRPPGPLPTYPLCLEELNMSSSIQIC